MKQPSRRAVLRGAVVATAAASLPVGLAGVARGAPGPTRLRRGVFRPLVGQRFAIGAGGQAYVAELVSIGDMPKASETRFTLLFQVVGSGRPAEGIHGFAHPGLRAFDLYVGPVGAAADGYYEAVVSY